MIKLNQSGIAQVLVLVLLLGGILAGVYLVGQRTNLLPKANISDPISSGATLTLNPSSGNFGDGCTFSVDIIVNTGGAETDGTDAILFYNPSQLIAKSITNGKIYSDYPSSLIDSKNGRILTSGLSSPAQGFSGKGILATINFAVTDLASNGTTQLTFDFDPNNKSKTTDSNVVESGTATELLNFVVNGNYSLGEGSCSPTPSPDPDSDGDGWTNSQEVFIGTDKGDGCPDNKKDPAWPPDFDNNKKVSKDDNKDLRKALGRPYNKRFDLNIDGKLDSADVSLHNSYLNKSCSN